MSNQEIVDIDVRPAKIRNTPGVIVSQLFLLKIEHFYLKLIISGRFPRSAVETV